MAFRGFARGHDSGRVRFPASAFRGFAHAHDFGRVRLAPAWLRWGASAGKVAGELFRVGYTLTRPALTSATLTLADGRELTLTLAAGHLEVLLPADTPAGWATVTALLEDAAGVTGTATVMVLLVGVAVPGTPTRPAPPLGPRAKSRRYLRSEASVRVVAAPEALRRSGPPVRVVVDAGATHRQIRRAPLHRGRSLPATVTLLAGAGRVRGGHRAGAALTLASGETGVTRRDGRGVEEALLLDLL